MIKMSGVNKNTKRPMILLGLSFENIKRMNMGHPIHIHADQLGFAGDIVVITGETEDAMAAMLKPFIGPMTTVSDSRHDKKN